MSRPFAPRPFPSREPQHRRNGKIRAREVRVIDEAKAQLGVMLLNDALQLARNRGVDLIEIAPNALPPVCRLGEYGKFLYEEAKKSKESHGGIGNRMKELQLTPGIDPHDFATKLGRAIDFLCHDTKVRIKLRFRGRQKAHKEYGFEVVNNFVTQAAPFGKADAPPKMLGDRDLSVVISPLARDKRAKNPRQSKPSFLPPSEPEAPAAQPSA